MKTETYQGRFETEIEVEVVTDEFEYYDVVVEYCADAPACLHRVRR